MSDDERVLVYECISGGGLAVPAAPGLLAQGVAMRDALTADLQRADRVTVSCVATRHAPLPSSLSRVGCVVADADGDPVPAADFLRRAGCDYDRVWAVAPESDGLLAALEAAVGPRRWVGCTQPAIRIAASKSATRARLAAAGIPVPPAWQPDEPEPFGGGAWVVKPDDGAGSDGIRVHPDFPRARADLVVRRAQGFPSTAEAWIDGVPLSLSLLVADGRAELLSINHQRVSRRANGRLAYEGVEIQAAPLASPAGSALASLAQRIAAAIPGLAGYVGVDLVWRPVDALDVWGGLGGPGDATVIEVNPRLTCAYVGLSAALGRNLAAEVLRAPRAEGVALVGA